MFSLLPQLFLYSLYLRLMLLLNPDMVALTILKFNSNYSSPYSLLLLVHVAKSTQWIPR